MSACVKPYVRLRRTAFPEVILSFSSSQDDYGNHMPRFDVVGWRPRGDFANILGDGLPEIEGPKGVAEVEELPPPPAVNEYDPDIPPPDDDVEF